MATGLTRVTLMGERRFLRAASSSPEADDGVVALSISGRTEE
jgi:hypothetical protein